MSNELWFNFCRKSKVNIFHPTDFHLNEIRPESTYTSGHSCKQANLPHAHPVNRFQTYPIGNQEKGRMRKKESKEPKKIPTHISQHIQTCSEFTRFRIGAITPISFPDRTFSNSATFHTQTRLTPLPPNKISNHQRLRICKNFTNISNPLHLHLHQHPDDSKSRIVLLVGCGTDLITDWLGHESDVDWLWHESYCWLAVARILLLLGCGTKLIVGWLWHQSWLAVPRILLLVGCGTNLIVGWLCHESYS